MPQIINKDMKISEDPPHTHLFYPAEPEHNFIAPFIDQNWSPNNTQYAVTLIALQNKRNLEGNYLITITK